MQYEKRNKPNLQVAELKVSYTPVKNISLISGSQATYRMFLKLWDSQLINYQE